MKKIYLFCSQGMSTSMLASLMQEAADKHNLPCEVKAYPHGKLGEIVEQLHPDVILLGPQVKYLLEETVQLFGSTGIPIDVISQEDYGMMDGERVLKKSIMLLKKKKAEESK